MHRLDQAPIQLETLSPVATSVGERRDGKKVYHAVDVDD
jgi:hypothetical protein